MHVRPGFTPAKGTLNDLTHSINVIKRILNLPKLTKSSEIYKAFILKSLNDVITSLIENFNTKLTNISSVVYNEMWDFKRKGLRNIYRRPRDALQTFNIT